MVIEQTIVVPELHEDESLGSLCPDLRWMCPGTDAAGSESGIAWPLSAAEVGACLREAEQWAASGLTDTEARSRHLLACTEGKTRQENRAVLEVRRALADSPVGRPSYEADPETLREAQRFLLLAWAQEERLLEIRRLAAQSVRTARRLQDVLGDEVGGGEPRLPAGLPVPGLRGGDEARLAPAWRPVLERLALFLPASAILCTRDPRMIEALGEAGLCGDSLESAGLVCPDALLPLTPCWRLRGACLPMWRVLGYTQAQTARPWLEAERLFVIVTRDGTDAHG